MKLKDTDKIVEELTKIKDKKRKDNAEAFVNNQLDISYWLNAQATQLDDVIRLIEKAPTEEERPQGEWILDSDNLPICKECGEVALQRVFVKMPHLIQDVRMVKSNFCPNCGSDMRKGEEE